MCNDEIQNRVVALSGYDLQAMAGIYIHIPFCKQACYYCDFHFSTNQERRAELTEALCRELVMQAGYLSGEPIHTLYFGGGTPSILTDNEFDSLIDTIRSTFAIQSDPEFTLEANPDDLTPARLHHLREKGVNRLSIGIQSFHPEALKFLNRSHDGQTAEACVHQARNAGFDNISVDLIYAIPGQPKGALQENIDRLLRLNPEHISAYALTIEPKTVFGNWASKGKLTPVEDDAAALQMEQLADMLEHAGYEHYEVSNFARPGYYSKHNSSYWRQESYLGIGPSAHSFNGTSRQHNVRNNAIYLTSIQKNKIPFQKEILSPADRINEYLLTTLRTKNGCNVLKLKTELNFDLLDCHAAYLETLFAKKLAVLEDSVLKLTRKGLLLADKIASDLFETS